MDTSLLTTIEEQLKCGTTAEREYINLTLRKILEVEISILDRELNRFGKELQEYEERHNMTSEVFLERFNAGEMGDDREFIRWYACKNTCDELAKRKRGLRSQLD